MFDMTYINDTDMHKFNPDVDILRMLKNWLVDPVST